MTGDPPGAGGDGGVGGTGGRRGDGSDHDPPERRDSPPDQTNVRPVGGSTGWGAPSIYGRAVGVEERTAQPAERWDAAEPASSSGMQGVSDPLAGPIWGQTSYVGRWPRHARRSADRSVAQPRTAEPPTGADDSTDATHQVAVIADPANEAGPPAATGDPRGGRQKGLLASSRTMAIASLASRLTGFLRSALIVAALGLSVGDAYNSANSFPNMVYELLLGGVLSSVLIPLLVHAQERDPDRGEAYTQRLLSIATAALGVATLFAVALAPYIAAGFVDAGPKRQLTSIFATLLLPEIFFYGLGAMFTAILNTRNVYGPGAWAPVLNNVITLITVGIFLTMPGPKTLDPSTITTPQILVIGVGTTLGIVGQALVVIPSLRRAGFRWRWRFRAQPQEAGRLREAARLGGWVIGYAIASQVGVTVILKVANAEPLAGGVTIFTNADLLFQMPYGILGVSLLTALMPRMSRAAARGEIGAVVDDLSLGARLSAIALVPITAGLIALGPLFTTIFFAYGQNTIAGARQFGVNLAMASFGLLPFAIVMLQLRVFYALKDARTPTLINVFMVGTKVVLVLLSAHLLHGVRVVEALNVATSLSYLVGAIVGHLLLTRRIGRLGFGAVGASVARIVAFSAVAGSACYAVMRAMTGEVGTGRLGSLVALLVAAVAGVLVLAGLVVILKPRELREVRAALHR